MTDQSGLSLEFFPPSTVAGERALMTCAHALRRFAPSYQTVTFGADGGERDSTLHWAETLEEITDVRTATHVTLCAFDREGFARHIDDLSERGLTRIVLLRGDAVSEGSDGLAGFADVASAVRILKKRGFDVTVAAYPEVHPKAASADADLNVLLAKFDAGADRAVTQFFFDEAPFLRLRDRLAGLRPEAILVPGLMPIADFDRTSSFAAKCGAAVPDLLAQRFATAGADGATQVARSFVERQACALAREGERRLHLYTMNRVDLTADALRAFVENVPTEAAERAA